MFGSIVALVLIVVLIATSILERRERRKLEQAIHDHEVRAAARAVRHGR